MVVIENYSHRPRDETWAHAVKRAEQLVVTAAEADRLIGPIKSLGAPSFSDSVWK